MAVTILKALQNADYNLNQNTPFIFQVGLEQFHNAVTLLTKGYTLTDLVEPLLEKYGEVENVPDKSRDNKTLNLTKTEGDF